MYCGHCGRNVGDQTLCRSCGAYKVGLTWHPADTHSGSLLGPRPNSRRRTLGTGIGLEAGPDRKA